MCSYYGFCHICSYLAALTLKEKRISAVPHELKQLDDERVGKKVTFRVRYLSLLLTSKCKSSQREFASLCLLRWLQGYVTDDRSSALTQDQHAPVLPLALQDDVTSLSVCQQAALSSYLQQQFTDLIQSDLQRQKSS